MDYATYKPIGTPLIFQVSCGDSKVSSDMSIQIDDPHFGKALKYTKAKDYQCKSATSTDLASAGGATS